MQQSDVFLNSLNKSQKDFCLRHGIKSQKDLLQHVESICELFNEVSQGVIKAFNPVMDAYSQFLRQIPTETATEMNKLRNLSVEGRPYIG